MRDEIIHMAVNIENECVEISEAEYQYWRKNIIPFGWFIIK